MSRVTLHRTLWVLMWLEAPGVAGVLLVLPWQIGALGLEPLGLGFRLWVKEQGSSGCILGFRVLRFWFQGGLGFTVQGLGSSLRNGREGKDYFSICSNPHSLQYQRRVHNIESQEDLHPCAYYISAHLEAKKHTRPLHQQPSGLGVFRAVADCHLQEQD